MSRRRYRRHQFRSGPWVGVRETLDPGGIGPNHLAFARNIYPMIPGTACGWRQRPGYQRRFSIATAGILQGKYQYDEYDGTQHTVFVAGGKFYEHDWTLDSNTEIVTTAQLTLAGVTLSSTARVYFTTFAGQLIVSDGVNTPWMWDGTSGGGVTLLSNAPVAFGPPVVYGAKLFFIKSTERGTIVWSEEGQANTGYEVSPYDNAWALAQTSTAPLTVLWPTNDALYYFRPRSIGVIYGSVTSDFRASATTDAISQTVGTVAPASVTQGGDYIYFFDMDNHPQRLLIGGSVQDPPLWRDAALTCSRMTQGYNQYAITVWDPTTDMVLFAVNHPEHTDFPTTAGELNRLLVFHSSTGTYCGAWDLRTVIRTLSVLSDANTTVPRQRLCHGDSDGYWYDHGTLHGNLFTSDRYWRDVDSSNVAWGIDGYLRPGSFGLSTDTDKLWQTFRAGLRGGWDFLSYAFETPNGPVLPQESTGAVTGRFSSFVGGPIGYIEKKVEIGLNHFGRYTSVELEVLGSDENPTYPYGLDWVELEAVDVGTATQVL